ncbi:hypothetical protein A5320_02305 [Rheinheimera sp. SA_1]|uniref:hypothetical protein n=1 Tax=Rheinheimera sp. SA_1 TaxID=1827365 RepID=UPI0007FFE9CF|nr:hypothetical protein [Rheinheimera sp. SA_1]OBP16263.1 hypothetical protein A5320_02305 [Rheinheimera sp. SA_1]
MSVTQEEWLAASKAERAAMFPMSQHSDETTNQLLKRCQLFASENPSLTLTLLYLAISLMGLLFQTTLLYRFGLNVLPYLEISDFLLAALTHPEVVLALALMVSVFVAAIAFERHCRSKIFRYAQSTETSFQRWWAPQPTLWMPLLLISYLVMAAWSNGNKLAKNIRADKGSKLEILLVYPMPQKELKTSTLQGASLISRTASYLFIYHENRVKVLPHTNVAALLPDLQQDTQATTPTTLPKPDVVSPVTVVSDKAVTEKALADKAVIATDPKDKPLKSASHQQTTTEQIPLQVQPKQGTPAPAVKDEATYQ